MAARRGGRRSARGGRAPAAAALGRLARAHWPFGLAALLLGLGGVLGLALWFPGGTLATPLHDYQERALGWTAPLVTVWLVAAGGALMWWHLRPAEGVSLIRATGGALATLALIGLAGLYTFGQPEAAEAARRGVGGGVVGLTMARLLAGVIGATAAWVVLALAFLGGLLLLLRVPPRRLASASATVGATSWRLGSAGARRLHQVALPRPRPDLAFQGALPARVHPPALATFEPAPETPASAEPSAAPRKGGGKGRGKAVAAAEALPLPEGPLSEPSPRSPWRLPPLSLLALPASPQVASVDLSARARIIEETLESFNISARVAEVNEGPTVTQFGVEPAMGVTVSRIMARQNDLALRLGATSLRMEAPVPGKRVVGIEVPNSDMAVVTLREILAAPEFERLHSRLGIALGRDVTGRVVAADLAKMPHLLIAGTTGSGKSVCVNGLIACLLMQCTPQELHLLMIDPKTIELTPYEGIPHLRLPVVTDMDKVVGVLKWAIGEMERRYSLFAKHRVRNLATFNDLAAAGEEGVRALPYLVIVIDELADLMMTAPDEVETCIARLAQKARAAGIHLVVATQRPSVDVVTGLIKANFPTRIAFAVSAQVDSRVILDMPGAERLLGRGDMLYLSGDAPKPVRVQGNYLSDDEIAALVGFWREQGSACYDPEEIAAVESLGNGKEDSGTEDLVARAADVAREHTRISVSLLQRRLGIGYPRAARLMDTLAARGIVQASEDGKSWVAAGAADETMATA